MPAYFASFFCMVLCLSGSYYTPKKFFFKKISDIGIGPDLVVNMVKSKGTGPYRDLLGES
jgi:hypothetical protein